MSAVQFRSLLKLCPMKFSLNIKNTKVLYSLTRECNRMYFNVQQTLINVVDLYMQLIFVYILSWSENMNYCNVQELTTESLLDTLTMYA